MCSERADYPVAGDGALRFSGSQSRAGGRQRPEGGAAGRNDGGTKNSSAIRAANPIVCRTAGTLCPQKLQSCPILQVLPFWSSAEALLQQPSAASSSMLIDGCWAAACAMGQAETAASTPVIPWAGMARQSSKVRSRRKRRMEWRVDERKRAVKAGWPPLFRFSV